MQRMPYLIKEGANQQPVIVTRGGEFAVPEISAIVLDHVRNVAARSLGRDVGRAVVTVPASFNDAQRSATATAGAIAGITVVRVLNEPTAAALAYGHSRHLSKVIAVYDFGGGTFDVTLCACRIRSTRCSRPPATRSWAATTSTRCSPSTWPTWRCRSCAPTCAATSWR
jgi:molecular chaperone DnaK